MAQFILIGNYSKDRQESMERFAQMLHEGLKEVGLISEIWRPPVILGVFFRNTNSGIGKWVAYLDKWLLFSIILGCRVFILNLRRKEICYHICDHSNAPYLKCLPSKKTAITCHDVIAIRAALGYPGTYVPVSKFGILFQKWILNNLSKAQSIASVSQLTHSQLKELVSEKGVQPKSWKIIYNTFNANFTSMNKNQARQILKKYDFDSDIPYFLHVGSALARKNRKLLIDMVSALGERWKGNICFAGRPVEISLMTHAEQLGLQDRIISITNPNHITLQALYSSCTAFIFPSFSEGFGWPIIEAQACGALVIASNIEPMPEISGGAALHLDPTNPNDFAMAFLSLKDLQKESLIKRGYENCERFSKSKIINAYLELHGIKRNHPKTVCF